MINEENLTAIEWLMEQIVFEHKCGLHPIYNENVDLTKFFKKALKMEKQQIVKAYYGESYSTSISNGEQYYKETFYK